MTDSGGDHLIYFNGISGETGTYFQKPLPLDTLAEVARTYNFSEDHKNDLEAREFYRQGSYGVPPEYGDGSDIRQANWGLIFPASADPAQVDAILQALDPLVRLRETQMGHPAKIYREADGFRWINTPEGSVCPQTKNEWLVKQGAGPGPVDPSIVPFYLLIVADPLSIPYIFQYELDVQYAVGRIYFNKLEDYARYANSVVEAASGRVRLARKAVFFGVSNPDDIPTQLSAQHLVQPLCTRVNTLSTKRNLGWQTALVAPDQADRQTLQTLLGGSQTPALLFTASHGMRFSYRNPDQYRYQGALLCQDWKGPETEPATRKHFLAAEDIPDSHNLLGSIVLHVACFGLGTPYWDDFAIALNKDRKARAARPFIAALPQRLLAHPNGGALAVIGHIDQAWPYSFQWNGLTQQTGAFQSLFYQLMVGKPVGLAMESINDRYSEIATMLSNTLEQLRFVQKPPDSLLLQLIQQYTANNDARDYAILGDPAVCLPLAPMNDPTELRPVIHLAAPVPGVLPVVLDAKAPLGLNEEERQAIAAENQFLTTGVAPSVPDSATPIQPPVQPIVKIP